MSAVAARVARFNSFINPVFDERLRSEAGIELQVHPMPLSQALADAALQGVHAYHVSAAKDEQPPFAFVTPALIAACPDLLCASSAGAGYDPIDVAACTRAGIAVVNQTGGNAVSVAEHTLGLILSVAHRIAESDRLLPLLARHDFTFLIEDPATIWHLGPQRYPQIAEKYVTPHQDKLAIDINIRTFIRPNSRPGPSCSNWSIYPRGHFPAWRCTLRTRSGAWICRCWRRRPRGWTGLITWPDAL